jgi:hypothetical protein
MKYSMEHQEDGVPTADFGRAGVETVEIPFKPKYTPVSEADKVDPQTPNQPVSDRFPSLQEQEVMLTFFALEAKKVNVAGNFNNWNPDATPMKNRGDGEWVVRLLLNAGQYEYRFVVDGRWCEDPRASQLVSNSHGEFNSVLVVPLAVRTSIL